jgi:hypothetical protein
MGLNDKHEYWTISVVEPETKDIYSQRVTRSDGTFGVEEDGKGRVVWGFWIHHVTVYSKKSK